jgi:hypothetical protein
VASSSFETRQFFISSTRKAIDAAHCYFGGTVRPLSKCTPPSVPQEHSRSLSNTDGRWFNKVWFRSGQHFEEANLTVSFRRHCRPKRLLYRRILRRQGRTQFYSAGNHGTCRALRRAMQSDYKQCSASARVPLVQTLEKSCTRNAPFDLWSLRRSVGETNV